MFKFPFCHLITGRMIPILGGPGCYNSSPQRLSGLSYNSYKGSHIIKKIKITAPHSKYKLSIVYSHESCRRPRRSGEVAKFPNFVEIYSSTSCKLFSMHIFSTSIFISVLNMGGCGVRVMGDRKKSLLLNLSGHQFRMLS